MTDLPRAPGYNDLTDAEKLLAQAIAVEVVNAKDALGILGSEPIIYDASIPTFVKAWALAIEAGGNDTADLAEDIKPAPRQVSRADVWHWLGRHGIDGGTDRPMGGAIRLHADLVELPPADAQNPGARPGRTDLHDASAVASVELLPMINGRYVQTTSAGEITPVALIPYDLVPGEGADA